VKGVWKEAHRAKVIDKNEVTREAGLFCFYLDIETYHCSISFTCKIVWYEMVVLRRHTLACRLLLHCYIVGK